MLHLEVVIHHLIENGRTDFHPISHLATTGEGGSTQVGKGTQMSEIQDQEQFALECYQTNDEKFPEISTIIRC